MLEKYKQEVMRFYELKKAAGELPTNLMNFTPANIRNEARLVYGKGCSKMDKGMLRDFFGCKSEEDISDLVFKKCDPDKFRPLCNYLKKGIKSHERNIEILAWLIDFSPRPFSNFWRTSNGPMDLSKFSITEKGLVADGAASRFDRSGFEPVYLKSRETPIDGVLPKNDGVRMSEEFYKSDYISQVKSQKTLTLEYPSGVKLVVDASDISLIGQLVKL